MFSNELTLHLRSYTKALYVIVDEEDRFLVEFHNQMRKHSKNTYVFNAALGLQPINKVIDDWTSKKHEPNAKATGINETLLQIYRDSAPNEKMFYLILDPERWLKDDFVVRRVLNILHQGHQDVSTTKCLIFVGNRRYIPEKLQRYVEVVNESQIPPDEIEETVRNISDQLEVKVPENVTSVFGGLTTYEIEAAISQSYSYTKMNKEVIRIDPQYIAKYKRSQVRKTDLVQLVDTGSATFDSIGGAQRFKTWASKHLACWTEKGQSFGLTPPRGVLLVGVYGCGKSLSAKALAHEWKLPLVQFEMGRIRSSAVGESESNLYRALRIVDSVAPCVLWLDEAEKSLAGAASSGYSDAGTTARLLGILSTWTQESKVPVCLVLTANSLKGLPPEMVNRMPERFFFDLPSEEDRIDILKIHAKKVKQDVSSFRLADLAESAKNLVGREIEQAIHAAMVESYHQKKPQLDESILARELARKPRIISTMFDEIKEVLDWVGYDSEAGDGIRARLASDRQSEHFKQITGI